MAKRLDCTQSAVSRFEGGRLDTLSVAKVRQMAEILGLALDESALRVAEHPMAAAGTARRFCASVWCPSCIPYLAHERLCVLPTLVAAEREPNPRFCDLCGEPMQDRCPGCGSAPTGRAFCPACGHALVPVDQAQKDEILAVRRVCPAEGREIGDLQALLSRWQDAGVGPRAGGGRDLPGLPRVSDR